ncbi:unnamed protein product [Victoria cruziana]
MTSLFTPLQMGALNVPNRVFMAPLTRARAGEIHLPNALMAEHYAQRASAGLLIAEATMAMEGHSAFWKEPGLWHGGRACHPDLNGGAQPVAPSAIAITSDMVHTPKGKVAYTVPRALRDDELPGIVAGFKQAAENAKLAGFDGVEVHGANGYLIDEFLRDGSNQRSGPYGGPRENRARLLFEVLEATSAVWGSERVGLRLQKADLMTPARAAYKGVLIGNMGYSAEEATQAVAAGKLDAVAFGVPFLANPDLPERLRVGAPLNAANPATFYTEGPVGYTDYPRWMPEPVAQPA